MTLGNTPQARTAVFLEAAKSFSLEMKFIGQDGHDWPLEGMTVRLVVEQPRRLGGAEVINMTSTHDDVDNSITRFPMQASDLALDPDEYPYDITIINVEEYSTPVLKGTFIIGSNTDDDVSNVYSDLIDPTKGVLVTMGSTEVVEVSLDYTIGIKGDKGDKGDPGEPGGMYIEPDEPDTSEPPVYSPLWIDTDDVSYHDHDDQYAPIDHLHEGDFAPAVHTHDDRYYTEAEIDATLAGYSVDGHSHDTRYYTKAQVDSSLAGKSDTGHDHDARYYTKAQVDISLAGKSDTGHDHDADYLGDAPADGNQYARKSGSWQVVTGTDNDHRTLTNRTAADQHPIASITGLQAELDGKSDDGHGHSISDVGGLQSALNGKASTTHNHDGTYAPDDHTHPTSEVNGLDAALAGKSDTTHNHDGTYAPDSHTHTEAEITDLGNYLPESGGTMTGTFQQDVSATSGNPPFWILNNLAAPPDQRRWHFRGLASTGGRMFLGPRLDDDGNDPNGGRFLFHRDGTFLAEAADGSPSPQLVGTPTDPAHAATKQYVDENSGGGGTLAGAYEIVWDGSQWWDTVAGAPTAVRPAGVPAWPQAYVVWDTKMYDSIVTPPGLAVSGDEWKPHPDVDPQSGV